MSFASEKQPLLDKKGQVKPRFSEFSKVGCPNFSTLLSGPLSCLPRIADYGRYIGQSLSDENDSDGEEQLPDLPSETNPTTLGKSSKSVEEKLYHLRSLMKEYKIGVYIVTSEDEHQSENTCLADKRREYISGFTGSAGVAVVTLDDGDKMTGEAALSTDGRYFLQAEQELDSKHWRLLKQGVPSNPSWNIYAMEKAIKSNFSNVVSCDPRLISVSIGDSLKRAEKIQYQSKFTFAPLSGVNLVDKVWGNERPQRSLEPVYHLPLKYSGEHTNDKVARLREKMASSEYGASHLIVSALDEVAWLFNMRSDDDIPFAPVFFSYSIVTHGSVILYINKSKLDNGSEELHQYLSTIKGLVIKSYEAFYDDISKLQVTIDNPDIKLILPDKSATTYALYAAVPESYAKQSAVFFSIISTLKLVKNSTELLNAKVAQFKDSLVFIIFASWLERQLLVKSRKVSEYDAACKIFHLRSKMPNFKGLSYDSISSTGSNAAIIHYSPTKKNNSIIDADQVYLLDSGAHYLEGTTDITRTFKFGKKGLSQEQRKMYTLVLKGHLAVSRAKFPSNSTDIGTVLDSYARQPLWDVGCDFNHGTGHGVGSFGIVHEGPLYISAGLNRSDIFQKGAIVTDEPGYYVNNSYGIRVESELEIIQMDDDFGKTRSEEPFLGFGYLTKVPFCRKLIDKSLLSPVEIEWIDSYHKSIREDFCEDLLEMGNRSAYNWLLNETKPL